MISVNKTLVPTCKNYGINEYKLDESKIVKSRKKFSRVFSLNMKTTCLETQLTKIVEQKHNLALTITPQENESCLTFDFDNKNNYLVEDLKINISQNKECDVLLRYNFSKDSYHNGSIMLDCKKDSFCNLTIFCNNTSNVNMLNFLCSLKEDSTCNITIVNIGGGENIYNFDGKLMGKGGNLTLKTLYLGEKGAKNDFNYNITSFGSQSECYMEVVGALNKKAEKSFKGTIDFKKGALKAKGAEREFCLLLSNEAKSKALPVLLCEEKDVEGAHSSLTGRIDDKTLFYLMSRGLTKTEALKVYVKSIFGSVLNELNRELKQEIENIVDRKVKYDK